MQWYFWVIIGSVFGSLAAITNKKALFQEHALEFSSFRAIVTLLILSVFAIGIDLSISVTNALFLFIFATIASLGVILRNHLLRHADLSEVTPLDGVGGFFVLVLGILFLGEIPSRLQLAGVFLCILGVYVLEYDVNFKTSFKKFLTRPFFRQYFYVFILFAIVSVALRQILQEVNPLTTLFYFMFFMSLQILFVEVFIHGKRDFKDFKQAKISIVLTAFLMFFANLFIYVGLTFPQAQAVLVRTISVSATIILTLMGGRYFNEKHLLRKTIAASIIICAAILVII